MALQDILKSFLVFCRAEHHTLGCIGTYVIFAWSLVGVQPVLYIRHYTVIIDVQYAAAISIHYMQIRQQISFVL
eukprot:6213774-Pleurochrysis_carterae.AAC.3